jgi:NAD(P)-dependent dehydrogenase (short-subunit alcohol dehydrogenase family)
MSMVWFVTGASSGIGAGAVKAALAAGDRVVAIARNTDKPTKSGLRLDRYCCTRHTECRRRTTAQPAPIRLWLRVR